MKRRRKYVKYKEGGLLDFGTRTDQGLSSALAGLGQLTDQFATSALIRPDLSLMDNPEYSKVIGKRQKFDQTFGTVENTLIGSGVAPLQIVGGASKLIRTGLEAAGVGQKKLRRERNKAVHRRTADQIGQSNLEGAQLINSLPSYTAPAYGRKGMKLIKRPRF